MVNDQKIRDANKVFHKHQAQNYDDEHELNEVDRIALHHLDTEENILEIGAGTGLATQHLTDVIAFDLSKEMLEQNSGTKVQGAASELPFSDDTFDTVFCRSTLHHIPEPSDAYVEIQRILVPGGKFVTWHEPVGYSRYNDYFRKARMYLGDLLGRYRPENWRQEAGEEVGMRPHNVTKLANFHEQSGVDIGDIERHFDTEGYFEYRIGDSVTENRFYYRGVTR